MFTGWDLVLRQQIDDVRLKFERSRFCKLAFDKPVLQTQFPRRLCVDPWTNRILLSVSSASVNVLLLDALTNRQETIEEQCVDAAWYPFDSGLFVTGTVDRIRLWDTQKLSPVRSIRITGRCNQFAFSQVPSAAGLLAVATSHGELRLVNLLTGSAAHTLVSGIDAETNAVSWSPRDSYILATGGSDSRVLIWDTRKLNGYLFSLDEHSSEYSARTDWMESRDQSRLSRQTIAHSRAPITSVSFVGDGRCLLTTGSDGSVRLWREDMTMHHFHHTHVSFAKRVCGLWGTLGFHLANSQRSSLMFSTAPGTDNVIDCMDMLSGKLITSLSAHVRKIR